MSLTETRTPGVSYRVLCAIWLLQLVAAFAVCVNHLSFSVLKGVKLSAFWENEPTIWGIAFLAFSAGFLAQSPQSFDARDPDALTFTMRRFFRLALPTYMAIFFDIIFCSANSLGGGSTSWWPLVSVITLTQTWSYNVFGESSLPLPLGPSNLVWFGSCLFALFLAHSVTRRLWDGLSTSASIAMLCVAAGGCFLFFLTINLNESQLSAWSFEKYGTLLPPYQILNWLYLYNPVAEAGHYFAGVAIAQFLSRSESRVAPVYVCLIASVAVALIIAANTVFPKYLGANILLFLFIVLLFSRNEPKPLSIGPLFRYVTPLAYEIVIFHIMFYALFPLSEPTSAVGLAMVTSLIGRVVLVNFLMVAALIAFNQIAVFPLLKIAERSFGLKVSVDHHI